VLIHTYFTDGFYRFGKIFIESFKVFHGEEMPMVITTRNLNRQQLRELKSLYKNLTILNKKINMENISKRTGKSVETLKKLKHEIEFHHVRWKKGNVIWKQYISVEDRYRTSITEAMHYKGDEEFMMHIDADSYIRKSLDPIFKIIKENDITLIFRLDRPKINRKIFGSLVGFKLGKRADLFMRKWIKHIDAKSLKDKPIGYGQTSCYLAYDELKDIGIEWGTIPKKWVKSNLNEQSLIWSGNSSRGKTMTLNIFEKDFRRKK